MTIFKNDRGATIVFIALFLLLMLSFIGLAIDGAWLSYVRNQGQARVDSAALAGASAIPDGQTEVENRANTFSDQNSVVNLTLNPDNTVEPVVYNPLSNPPVSPASWGTCNGIRVSTAIPTPLFFSRLLNGGIPTTLINVSAVAVIPRRPNLPLTLLQCNSGPQTLTVNTQQNPDPTDTSAFTSFTLSSANAKTFKDLVNNPDVTVPPVWEGTCINVNNGQADSVLQAIVKKYSPFTPPPCFLVPVTPTFKPVQCQVVTGFAKICIIAVTDTGSPKTITVNVTCNLGSFAGTGVNGPSILVR